MDISCPSEVFGCCYSDELKRMIVPCGCNTLEHRLHVISFFSSFCSNIQINMIVNTIINHFP